MEIKYYLLQEIPHPMLSLAIVTTIICLLTAFIIFRLNAKLGKKIDNASKFRRRDKVVFIGKKVYRTIKKLKETIKHQYLYRKNEKIRRNIETRNQYSSWFEDLPELAYPDDIYFVGRIIKNLFHFERSIFFKIYRSLIIKTIEKDEILFDFGTIKEAIYVVQTGSVGLYYKHENCLSLLKIFNAGDSIFSLLLILEKLLTGTDGFTFDLQAKALEKSTLYIVPNSIFTEIYTNQLTRLIIFIQTTMLRLQIVNFNILNETFGLSGDLMVQSEEYKTSNYSSPFITSPAPEMIENIPFLLNPMAIKDNIPVTAASGNPHPYQHCGISNVVSIAPGQEPILLNEAVDNACLFLGEKVKNLLLSQGKIFIFKPNSYIVKVNDRDSNLFFVLSGCLVKTIFNDSTCTSETVVYTNGPGSFSGILAILTGHHSIFNIKTTEVTTVLCISKILYQLLIEESPKIMKIMAKTILSRLSPFVRNIDFSLDSSQYEAGQLLYSEDLISDNIYLVLNGRLRSYIKKSITGSNVIAEYGRNDMIGIVEVLEKTKRISNVVALRNSEVVIIPATFINMIQKTKPQIMLKIANFLSKRIVKLQSSRTDFLVDISSYSTIALIPTSTKVPIKNFAFELNQALNQISPATIVDSSTFQMSKINPLLSKIQAHQIITQLETGNVIILWQGEAVFSNWTKHCVRNADLILILAMASNRCKPSFLEKEINEMEGIKAKQHLVLLHDLDVYTPSTNTADWLNSRKWISDYHHIRCSNRIWTNKCLKTLYASNPNLYKPPPKSSDISRLARRITNTSIGLVLGGGGARGFAHIGVILALEEQGIPIDMIGGTSIGAFMGGVYSISQNSKELIRKANKFVDTLGGLFKQFTDITLPLVSILSGSGFNFALKSAIKERNIEDLLIPYYCVTSDLTNHIERIHKSGCLWRYVRGSMTLTNILPPICDPVDGHLLVDGGYSNYLPADIMANLGAKYVIAVDVSSPNVHMFGNYGDDLSGWKLLINKFNPFSTKIEAPNLLDIQQSLSFFKGDFSIREIKKIPNLIYLRPPVSDFTTLQFSEHEKITNIGYKYMKEILTKKNIPNIELLSNLLSTNSEESNKLISVLDVTLVSLVDLSSSTTVHLPKPCTENVDRFHFNKMHRSNSLEHLNNLSESTTSDEDNYSDGCVSVVDNITLA